MPAADPTEALAADRDAARQAGDPNAELCWLATVTADGWPQVRTLVLRDVPGGHGVFLHASSQKAAHLTRDPRCQVTCWFPSLQRQWRLQARAEALPRNLLEAHWQRRPRSSQLMDHLYATTFPQGSVLHDPEDLRQAHAALDQEWQAKLEAPSSAMALQLLIVEAECLQIHPGDRLHDRRRFRQGDSGWHSEALVP